MLMHARSGREKTERTYSEVRMRDTTRLGALVERSIVSLLYTISNTCYPKFTISTKLGDLPQVRSHTTTPASRVLSLQSQRKMSPSISGEEQMEWKRSLKIDSKKPKPPDLDPALLELEAVTEFAR